MDLNLSSCKDNVIFLCNSLSVKSQKKMLFYIFSEKNLTSVHRQMRQKKMVLCLNVAQKIFLCKLNKR